MRGPRVGHRQPVRPDDLHLRRRRRRLQPGRCGGLHQAQRPAPAHRRQRQGQARSQAASPSQSGEQSRQQARRQACQQNGCQGRIHQDRSRQTRQVCRGTSLRAIAMHPSTIQAQVTPRANVYFDGRCVSHDLQLADGSRKSVGIILAGSELTFNTGAWAAHASGASKAPRPGWPAATASNSRYPSMRHSIFASAPSLTTTSAISAEPTRTSPCARRQKKPHDPMVMRLFLDSSKPDGFRSGGADVAPCPAGA
uniref:Uncharacterized protein n=1 Tax=mine drainage metagenome TaxID=410659 RepID=E6PPT5_9ZZZZ